EQRNQSEERDEPGEPAHRKAKKRSRVPQRALQVGDVNLVVPGCRRATGGHRRPSSDAVARCTIHVPSAFTSKVMPRSTSAAYISAPTSILPASGKLLARRAARVWAGENTERLITLEFPASIARAMVSPSARPKPRTTEPKMPVAAVGMNTARIA